MQVSPIVFVSITRGPQGVTKQRHPAVLFDGIISTLEDMILLWKVLYQAGPLKLNLVAMKYARMLHSLSARLMLACSKSGTCDSTIIDFLQQASGHVKIHPAVGGVQEVCMQLNWREHTFPAFFIIPSHSRCICLNALRKSFRNTFDTLSFNHGRTPKLYFK